MEARRKLVRLSNAHLREGDVLLFHGSGPVAWLIQKGGRTRYSHAAMVVISHGVLLCCESREWCGCRAPALWTQVELYPGRIDVFRPKHVLGFSPTKAARYMLELSGKQYGAWAVFKAALLHAFIVRLFVEPDLNDEAHDAMPPFCSQAVADALADGGHDAVPNLANRYTEPGDLGRSDFLEYQYTLGGL